MSPYIPSLSFALLLATSASAQDLRERFKAQPGTNAQATLDLPAATLPEGAPLTLELTITTTGVWSGTIGARWERHDPATDTWLPYDDKSPGDPFQAHTPLAATAHQPMRMRGVDLFHLIPGTWRVRASLYWLDTAGAEHTTNSAWRDLQIVAHAANHAAMRDTKHGLINPWQYCVEGSLLSDDYPIPPELRGKGLGTHGTPMADLARTITALRDSAASREVTLAAELTLLGRDVRRVALLAAGAQRTATLQTLRTRLEALAQATPAAASPLGGQHGEVLQLLKQVHEYAGPAATAAFLDNVHASLPALAARLGRTAR